MSLKAVLEAAIAHLIAHGPCDDMPEDAHDDDVDCSDAACTYCGLSRAVQEHEEGER